MMNDVDFEYFLSKKDAAMPTFVYLLVTIAVLYISPSCFTFAFSANGNAGLLLKTKRLCPSRTPWSSKLFLSSDDNQDDGVIELGDDVQTDQPDQEVESSAIPPLFISQGEIDEDALKIDLSDGKQTRVILYVIVSLLPVLFLIPLMLGRDLVPLESLPPVEISSISSIMDFA